MDSFAILVDGGFVKRKLGSAKSPATAESVQALIEKIREHPFLAGKPLYRVYFYDATPLNHVADKPLNGGKVDFGKSPIVARSRKFHSELVRLPYVALRMGELGFRGWALKQKAIPNDVDEVRITHDQLDPLIQQKGVDMRLGLDIAALALKKLVRAVVLVTGDSDFVPAMKFARREGLQLFLVPLGHGIYETMREHSDAVLEIA